MLQKWLPVPPSGSSASADVASGFSEDEIVGEGDIVGEELEPPGVDRLAHGRDPVEQRHRDGVGDPDAGGAEEEARQSVAPGVDQDRADQPAAQREKDLDRQIARERPAEDPAVPEGDHRARTKRSQSSCG